MENVWKETLRVIEGRISKQSFETWFKPTIFDSLGSNTVKIKVPNKFFNDWLTEHYLDLINETLRTISNKNFKVSFLTSKENLNIHPKNKMNSAVEKISSDKAEYKMKRGFLNPKYTFDSFVVGNNNQFAHAASLAVAEQPSKTYNPLFLYGGVGLGKTHLLHAIGHLIHENMPHLKLCYLSSEKFMNEFINSIRYDKMVNFRRKYRNMDILLIDDIQFLAGKEQTQEEFFHTFNALYDLHKQIIISSDKFPKEIPKLEDRLRSRFGWGLIADIQPPNLETKIAILKKKADINNINLPDDVSFFISSNIKSNIRDLEGALIRISAFASLTNCEINIDLAKEVLKNILDNKPKFITIDMIKKEVSIYFNIKLSDMKSKRRTQNIAYPRQIAMFLCRILTKHSLPEIGREFGGRDHTTVIHAFKLIDTRKESDLELNSIIENLTQNIVN